MLIYMHVRTCFCMFEHMCRHSPNIFENRMLRKVYNIGSDEGRGLLGYYVKSNVIIDTGAQSVVRW